MINRYLGADLTCAAPLTQVESANAAQEMKFLPRPTRTEYNPLDTIRLALPLIGDSFLSPSACLPPVQVLVCVLCTTRSQGIKITFVICAIYTHF